MQASPEQAKGGVEGGGRLVERQLANALFSHPQRKNGGHLCGISLSSHVEIM